MSEPLAYFITFTCYGTWLHGDERGSVDRSHNNPIEPVLPPNFKRQQRERAALQQPPYSMDQPRRLIVRNAIIEIAQEKRWQILALHVRTNHIHAIVKSDVPVERVMNAFKTAASRRLNQAYPDERKLTRWTRHGSTRYLWTQDALETKVEYVLNGQGEPMERFPD